MRLHPVASLSLLAFVPAAFGSLPTLNEFAANAAAFNSVIVAPSFATSPDQIRADAKRAIDEANRAYTALGAQDPSRATFESTFRASALIDDQLTTAALAIGFIERSNPSPAMREASDTASKEMNDFSVEAGYREDVYRVLKAFADRNPPTAGEDRRLVDYTMRDFRREGMDLPGPERAKLEALFKQLSSREEDFQTNVIEAKSALVFSKTQLAGVSEHFLESPGIKTGPDAYTVHVNITPERMDVLQNCGVPDTRHAIVVAEFNLARKKNVPLLNQIVGIRGEIARRLGYGSWDDYRTETKMAKTGAAATQFIQNLVSGITPKYESELAEMNALKAKDTGDPHARVDIYDWRYYQNQLVKTKYTVDTDALRVFFPYQRCLDGMFRIYSSIFGIKFEQLQPPYVWADGVTFWGVSDAQTGEPLGLFYLDMFPRDGKYNHFAEFTLQQAHRLADGRIGRPVAALLCNFPPPSATTPPLLAHSEVETMFHEFGHCMHAILTRANYGRFAGTSVPRDFVEAPSQMLQNWVYDKRVLDTFAADYRDPTKKIPEAILDRLNEVRKGTAGVTYRRQLALALLDLRLHGPRAEGAPVNCAVETNATWDSVFLAVPLDSAFCAYFPHLGNGYDAGYYGYAWADAISADMATVFQKAPNGYLDQAAGRRMRDEIYSRGDTRDISVSVEKFLGRPESIQPFLERIGIEQ
ncbi:MAG TPA: M3 family metallopeptidase [Opitutaceae bacterium]|jgi:thimet oligopeptidase